MMKVANLSVSERYFKWKFVDGNNFNIENYIRNKETIYDSDNCGNEVNFYVLLIDGHPRYYRSEHSWYWDRNEDKEIELINEFEITEVIKEDLDQAAKLNLRFIV